MTGDTTARDRRGWRVGKRAFNGRAPRRDQRVLTVDGVTLPVVAWAARAGLARKTLESRLAGGWPIAQALNRPARRRRNA